jgi:hypothetical protein
MTKSRKTDGRQKGDKNRKPKSHGAKRKGDRK